MLDKLRLSALYLIVAGYVFSVAACAIDQLTPSHGVSLVGDAR